MTQSFDSASGLADAVIAAVGRKIVLGLPVGVGKAIHVANALFEKACNDDSISLTIFTGLTLEKPRPGRGLEARLAGPLLERLYGQWPDIYYARALRAGSLPANITVREFYLRPGGYLDNQSVQQHYTSINYSQVADALLDLGVNVIAQLVSRNDASSGELSLGCNPEVTLDLLPRLEERQSAGRPFTMIGQLNSSMPYMHGPAELDAAQFDFLLEAPRYDHPLFGLPNRRVGAADYATAMHVASLVPDGGTLQIGIGSLSDAVAHCLRLRHETPEVFRDVLAMLPGGSRTERRSRLPIESGRFENGLYACSELLSDALFSLFKHGILKRPADTDDQTLVHAGFFLGSNALYDALRTLPAEQRRKISMQSISFVNTLYGDEQRKRGQRTHGRFVNETMMASLLGAAISDALEDGRVVSGVGGQFDFVAMAAALQDANSILMLRARRDKKGGAQSNIRWSYGHTTVPRHTRDIYVSEYGVAATRGHTDSQVIQSMLEIADSEFQDGLIDQAQSAGKLPREFSLIPGARDNCPAAISRVFANAEIRALFPPYPMGTDLTPDEQILAVALEQLKHRGATLVGKLALGVQAIFTRVDPANAAALQRMGLHEPAGVKEQLMQRVVNLALEQTGQSPH